MRLKFSVAKELGMTLAELQQKMTPEELLGWSAYFLILNENQEKAIEEAKQSRR